MLVKLIASELTEGEIDFVSLVKHGANRSPFKIVKSDEAVQSTANYVHIGEIKDGPTTTTTTNTDGQTVWVNTDELKKDFSSFPGSTDFKENVSASAFFPSLHGAMEALAESTFNSLNKAINLPEAADQIDKNLGAFKRHVNGLVKSLPDSVIKMDQETLRKGIEGSTLDTSGPDSIGKEDGNMSERISEAVGNDLDGLNETIEKDDAAVAASKVTDIPGVAAAAGADTEEDQVLVTDGTQNAVEDPAIEKAAAEGADGVGDSIIDDVTDESAPTLPSGMPTGFVEEEMSVKQFVDGELIEVPAIFAVNAETEEQVFVGFVGKANGKGKKKENPFAPKAKEDTPEAADARMESSDPFMAGLNLIGKGMNAQNETLEKINETLSKQTETLQEVVKSNEAKIEKSEKITLVTEFDLDESLATLNGHRHVEKTDADDNPKEDVFKGLAPELDALGERMRRLQ